MFLVAGIFSYLLFCVVSGIVLVYRYRSKYESSLSPDTAHRIMRYPPAGKGILQVEEARRKGITRDLPSRWYELKAIADFNIWGLIIAGLVMLYWPDISWNFSEAKDVADLYGNMAKGFFGVIAMIFLFGIKIIILGIAYWLMVMMPRQKALTIERDFYKNR